MAAPARADADDAPYPPPFEDFTFRKIAPPSTGGGRRITIQIDPDEQARRLAPPPKPPEAPEEAEVAGDDGNGSAGPVPGPVDDPFRTFWALVSPRIEDAGPGRLEGALTALDAVDALRWPRLDDLRAITDRFGRDILRETVNTEVSPALVAAVIAVESAGRTDAVSHAGATGLMQLMPATAERFGVTDRTEAAQSIRGGVAYLDWLMGEFGRDPVMILAGYNAGEGAVWEHGGVPPYAETRAYVPKVLAAFRIASGLCMSPPQLVSDPCVFVGGGT
ncbi:MAG: lytic transglycosylase domain-containing protein [Pseudomonadota bacterium]